MATTLSTQWKMCSPRCFDSYETDTLLSQTTGRQIDGTWTHQCTDRQTCSALALTSTILRICQKVQTSELNACAAVADYIQKTDMEHIVSLMIESMDNNFPAFVLGINDNFSKLEYVIISFSWTLIIIYSLKTFQKDILTSKQGVYAAIVYRACG